MSDKKDIYYSTTSLLFDWDYLPEGDCLVHSVTDLLDFSEDTIILHDDGSVDKNTRKRSITRPFSERDISILYPIFGMEIDYTRITIIIGSALTTFHNRSKVVGNRIYVSWDDLDEHGNVLEKTLIHEATHVWQFQRTMGYKYATRAIMGYLKEYASRGAFDPYDYNTCIKKGIPWDSWNPDAQGDWISDKRRLPNVEILYPDKRYFPSDVGL